MVKIRTRRDTIFPIHSEEHPLASHQELSDFLAEVERRAFKHALYAVRDDATALDIVQDAMLKLVDKYQDRPRAELPPLFQRILQNAIRDHFRRSRIRNWWTPLLSSFRRSEDQEDFDLLESVEIAAEHHPPPMPEQVLGQKQVLAEIEQALEKLPPRQREAFLLRYWEEMDVAETAAAMGCSEGSVKTHCSRAVHALSALLSAKGIFL